MSGRRTFGSIRCLPSGRFQARYPGSDGVRRAAPYTFTTRSDARHWLSLVEHDAHLGPQLAPDEERLDRYGARWIAERAGLSESTAELYRGLLRLHITPLLGVRSVRDLTPPDIRTWRKVLLDDGVGGSTVAKAYRLLRAMLNTAVDDETIRRNPCRIKGADAEYPAERPILTLDQLQALTAAIVPRYRLLVLLAVFASLRWGELMGLRKLDFDLAAGLVHVERSIVLVGATQLIKRPKTPAGIRTVAFPMWLVPLIEAHFRDYSALEPDGSVFVGPYGKPPARPNFSPIWHRAITAAGLPGVHFHDLRHTGNHFAAMTGASTRELMGRMGHASLDAALIYQHRTASRDRTIADAVGALWQPPSSDPGSNSILALTRENSGADDENRTRMFSLGS